MGFEGFKTKREAFKKEVSKISFEKARGFLRQKPWLGWVVLGGGGYAFYCLALSSAGPRPSVSETKPVVKLVGEVTPLSSMDDRENWVSRIEKSNAQVLDEVKKGRDETVFLSKELDMMKGVLEKALPAFVMPSARPKPSTAGGSSAQGFSPPPSGETSVAVPLGLANRPASFPLMGGNSNRSEELPNQTRAPSSLPSTGAAPVKETRKKARLVLLTDTRPVDHSLKGADHYLPAGTYFKAVITMGVVCSVATNSSSDPQPILLRLVDNGNLPGGLKGKMRDAVIIGACHSDASSERAKCRLQTLSWRDPSGRQIEKPLAGWISGEDGMQGIRGKVVDRSSEIAREAFGAGLLSAASNFLKFEASSSVYPVTPFGQTNQMGKMDALKGAVGTGAGSALDKLATFSIKRAESMSPVVVVSSGRVVEVVLLKGVDLSPVSEPSLKLVNDSPPPPSSLPSQGDTHEANF